MVEVGPSCTHGPDCPRKLRENNYTPAQVAAAAESRRLIDINMYAAMQKLEDRRLANPRWKRWLKASPFLLPAGLYAGGMYWLYVVTTHNA